MKNFIKKQVLLYLFLFMASYTLYAAKKGKPSQVEQADMLDYTITQVKTYRRDFPAKPFSWCVTSLSVQSGPDSRQPLKTISPVLQHMGDNSNANYDIVSYKLRKAQESLNKKDNVINTLTINLRQKDYELKRLKDQLNKKEEELRYLKKLIQYKGKLLPEDLSGQNLSGFDFSGCQFTYTNLTDTNLKNSILTNTICNYQVCFENRIKNKLDTGYWYRNNLPKDLKKISQVYPKLNSNANKAKLLHIACGLSRLPSYDGTVFYIKLYYWYCALLMVKQSLGEPYTHQLVGFVEPYLNYEVQNCCWETCYPQDKVNIDTKTSHANFAQYLKDFNHKFIQYKCRAKRNGGFNWYKQEIIKNIQGLQKAYPNIKNKQLKQEACKIAHALSKSYQIQQLDLLHHYLFYQNRLIRLKESVNIRAKNDIYYSFLFRQSSNFLSVGSGVKNDIYKSCSLRIKWFL